MHLALFTGLFLPVRLPRKVALLKVVSVAFAGRLKSQSGSWRPQNPQKQGSWAGENVF